MTGASPFREWSAAQPTSAGTHGVESLVEGVVAAVGKRVWLFPGRRERGAALLRGAAAEGLDEARPYKVVPPGDSPSVRALAAVGVALAGEPAVCFLGTGSLSYGNVHEALQLAAAHRTPVVFVVAGYSGDGPFAAQLAVPAVVLAQSIGLGGSTCDGSDRASVQAAVAAAGPGPALVWAEMPHG